VTSMRPGSGLDNTLRLLLRSDSDKRLGTGHALRMLALAQAWKDRGADVLLAASEMVPAVESRFVRESIDVIQIAASPGTTPDAQATAKIAQAWNATVIALDGPQFGSDFQRTLRSDGAVLLLVDDEGSSGPYEADLVLNQNLHADPDLYAKRRAETRLLLGTKYVLLRREFRHLSTVETGVASDVRTILVTLGGADPQNMTSRVIRYLLPVLPRPVELHVILGAANVHGREIDELAEFARGRIRLSRDVQSMVKLMSEADIAITSGGTTVWELAACGVPSIVGSIAPIEDRLLTGLRSTGVFTPVGPFGELDSDALQSVLCALMESASDRRRMSEKAKRLVDGRGCDRVIDAVLTRISTKEEPSRQ